MMQGVVQRGTGTAVAAVGKPLAGKTGTTSDWFDAWFVGFSPDLAAGVFVGFDEPRTLGNGEVGGHVAAPIFRDFMAQALKDVPATPFPAPPPAAAPLVASVSYSPSPSAGSPSASAGPLVNLDDDRPIADRSAPAVRDYPGNVIPRRADPAGRGAPPRPGRGLTRPRRGDRGRRRPTPTRRPQPGRDPPPAPAGFTAPPPGGPPEQAAFVLPADRALGVDVDRVERMARRHEQ